MINIAICDDDCETVKLLESLLKERYRETVRIHTFTTAFSLLTYLQDEAKGEVDLLLADIEISKDNGIQVAGRLQTQYPHLKVIFITGYIDYARYIFKADPADFIVKPIDEKRLYEAVDKVLSKMEAESEKMLKINSKGEFIKLRTDDILYIEMIQKIAYIHSVEKETATRKKLGELLEELPHNFVRCHQSYIVNMDKITYFSSEHAELSGGQYIPISRNRYRATREVFMKYLGDEM